MLCHTHGHIVAGVDQAFLLWPWCSILGSFLCFLWLRMKEEVMRIKTWVLTGQQDLRLHHLAQWYWIEQPSEQSKDRHHSIIFVVFILQLHTWHENKLLLILLVGQKLFLLHCGGHVSSNCYSCTSLSFWSPCTCTFKFRNGKERLQNFIPVTGDGRRVKKGLCHSKQCYLLNICYK